MATVTKAEFIAVLRRTGNVDKIARAQASLPVSIDTERDAAVITALGVTYGGLLENMGSSSS